MAENRKQAGVDSSHPESQQGQTDDVRQANESGEPKRSGRPRPGTSDRDESGGQGAKGRTEGEGKGN